MRIAVFNQKGGTGKTTIAIHLARALGEGSLLIDLDPQGSATHLLGVDNPGRGLYQALKGELRPCDHPAITSAINELKERLLNG